MDKFKVLLIDDEVDILDVLEETIASYFEGEVVISKASTYEEARKKIRNCDIIISDIKMPKQDELTKMLIRYGKEKVVYRMSGHYTSKDGYKNLEMSKPFAPDDVRNVIGMALLSAKALRIVS